MSIEICTLNCFRCHQSYRQGWQLKCSQGSYLDLRWQENVHWLYYTVTSAKTCNCFTRIMLFIVLFIYFITTWDVPESDTHAALMTSFTHNAVILVSFGKSRSVLIRSFKLMRCLRSVIVVVNYGYEVCVKCFKIHKERQHYERGRCWMTWKDGHFLLLDYAAAAASAVWSLSSISVLPKCFLQVKRVSIGSDGFLTADSGSSFHYILILGLLSSSELLWCETINFSLAIGPPHSQGDRYREQSRSRNCQHDQVWHVSSAVVTRKFQCR